MSEFSYAVKSGTTIADAQLGCVVKLSDAGEVDLATANTDVPFGIVDAVQLDGRVGVATSGERAQFRVGATFTIGTTTTLVQCGGDSRVDPLAAGGAGQYQVGQIDGYADAADGQLVWGIVNIQLNEGA